MKLAAVVLAAFCALIPALAAAQGARTKGVANAALVAAAKQTPLKDIDDDEVYCDGATSVAVWLTALVGREAQSIVWTGGTCVLVNRRQPIDAGGDWCAHATITLRHPARRDDDAMIEVFFDTPDHGRPGHAYAFRGAMLSAEGGGDTFRRRKEFEDSWRTRFPPAQDDRTCRDDDR